MLQDAGIVRHRGKIEAAIANARGTLALREAGTPLDEVVWRHRPKRRKAAASIYDLPATTPESNALSKELKRAGFRFVGPTTVYASMQACGVVNDHIARCFVRADVQREIDGAGHADPGQRLSDLLRDLTEVADGKAAIRIPLEIYYLDRDAVLDRLGAVFSARGWIRDQAA